MIDIGEEVDFRLAQTEAAPPRTYFLAKLDVIERVQCRVLLQVLVIALQHDGDRGVERSQHAR